MHPYFGRHFREVISSVLTLIVAGGGLYLAWTESAVWLNRAGAAVIIIGVLAATSRFQEWIEQKADSFIEDHFEPTTARAIAELESLHGEPSCGAFYQPYSSLSSLNSTALIGELALDALLGRVSNSVHRVWVGDVNEFSRNSLSLKPNWLSRINEFGDCRRYQFVI